MKKGWQTNKLGELAELKGRIGWRGLTAKEYTKKGPLFLSVHSLNYGDFVDFRGAFHINEARFDESPEIILRQNDVLICKDGAGIGKVGIVGSLPGKATINSSLLLVRGGKNILPKYLFHCLSSPYFQKIVYSRLNGATTPHLYQRDIAEFPVVLPPYSEQQRIVGILDKAFDGIATAKANAEKNLENARALNESHLESVFSRSGKKWATTILGDEIDLLPGFAFKSAQYTNSNDSVRLLRGDNILPGSLRWDNVKRWALSDICTYSRYELREGDVVIAMDRPWIKSGLKHAMIRKEDLPCFLVQRTARLRCGPKLDNRFLLYLIGSSKFTNHVLGIQTGIGVPHISGQQIEDFRFLRPTITEQRDIAASLDSLKNGIQNLESLYQRKLDALDELKKSLLHQAFSGQL
jgi:type I restriction enzyme, S subunit